MTTLPKRRFKLDSELDELERRRKRRLGSSGQVERPEYVKARRAIIRAGEEDPDVLVTLMREEAEALAEEAAYAETEALNALTPADHAARLAVKRPPGEKEPPASAEASKLRDRAAAIEAQAAELAAHMERERGFEDSETHFRALRR